MTQPRHRSRAAALFLALGLAGPAPVAASQYPLDQAYAIIDGEAARRLRKAGVRSTADFLTWGRTAEGRSLLAERAMMTVEQITAWVLLADLMRVRGIGPDVGRLLTAVGVRSIAELRRADANATASAVRDINSKRRLSTNPPGVESIRYWIEQAAGLPIVVALD